MWTLVIFISSALLFDLSLAFEIKSSSVYPENGVEEGGKVRLSCKLDAWYVAYQFIGFIISILNFSK